MSKTLITGFPNVRRLLSSAFALCSCLCAPVLQAETLIAVDLGQFGQDVATGFSEFSRSHLPIAGIDPQPFAGGTWDLESNGLVVVVRNYGDIDTPPLGNLLEDSYLANNSADGAYFELIFANLTPGTYTLTTYHHSFANGGASANVSGGFTGTVLVDLGIVEGTTGENISDFGIFSVDFAASNSNNAYSLRFEPINAAGSFHFDMSGFELTGTPVPLPPALLMLGAGLAWLLPGKSKI